MLCFEIAWKPYSVCTGMVMGNALARGMERKGGGREGTTSYELFCS